MIKMGEMTQKPENGCVGIFPTLRHIDQLKMKGNNLMLTGPDEAAPVATLQYPQAFDGL
ncbi:MAG: hypothetical protein L3J36_15250 [Rhodobacteraceae bacterium]|nr:hypothetical protein [Paracoccaceae bacterium]